MQDDTAQLEVGAKMLVSTPKDYPTALVDFLKVEFSKIPSVKKATLAQVLYIKQDLLRNEGKPILTLGLQITEYNDYVKTLLDSAFDNYLEKDRPIYVIPFSEDEDLTESFLRTVKPFYIAQDKEN